MVIAYFYFYALSMWSATYAEWYFIPKSSTCRQNFFRVLWEILHWCQWLGNIYEYSSVSLVGHMRGWTLVWFHTFLVWFSYRWNLLKISLQDYTVFECPLGSTCMVFACIMMCPWWYIKNKSFRSQLMNKYPYFVFDITLLTKNLVSNIKATGDPVLSS